MPDEKIRKSREVILSRLPEAFKPEIAVVLGTGLSPLAENLEKAVSVPYSDIPDYPLSTVSSHAGRFSFGYMGQTRVVLQEGRCHLYEGYSVHEVVLGLRIMASLGIKILVVTNSAGSLNPLFLPGSIMAITDQINFTGASPLAGIPEMPGLTRFPDMSRPYDLELLSLAEARALSLGIKLEKGVYLGLLGPQLETRAETRMFRQWGADAVGMSTVMEVIAARHLGIRVLGFSVLSNQNLPDNMNENSLEDIIRVSNQTAGKLRLLIHDLVSGCGFV